MGARLPSAAGPVQWIARGKLCNQGVGGYRQARSLALDPERTPPLAGYVLGAGWKSPPAVRVQSGPAARERPSGLTVTTSGAKGSADSV